ncbi:hypothetical protein ACWD25_26775 [Streptomyces sp. NPDC002920]
MGGERLHPLYGPDHSDITTTDLATELRMTRAFHTEATSTDIHDHTEMIKTATGLYYRLGALVAALDAERGAVRWSVTRCCGPRWSRS